jgi:hypothetical protein
MGERRRQLSIVALVYFLRLSIAATFLACLSVRDNINTFLGSACFMTVIVHPLYKMCQ